MREWIAEWWPAVFVFVLLALILLLVFSIPPDDPAHLPKDVVAEVDDPELDELPSPEEDASMSFQGFMELLEERAPRYVEKTVTDPVDGSEFVLPVPESSTSKNRFGGIATDLMTITLGPPDETTNGRPSLAVQEWDAMRGTNPELGTTYMEVDLLNIIGNPRYEIEEWDLAATAPGLAARGIENWTSGERILSHVLTQRAAGVEPVELAFNSLQGAYSANFNVWYGEEEVYIPSAAFYALAAAYFETALEQSGQMNKVARFIVHRTLGETYRLLGRFDDALDSFARAREVGHEDERELAMLDTLEQYAAAGDSDLHRAEIEGMPEPPVGWYVELMLPAINAHLDRHRDEWAGLDSAGAVLGKINERLAEVVAAGGQPEGAGDGQE
jgi:hypothetical protein